MREVMIACNTLKSEIEHVTKVHGVTRPIVWLESQLHNVTAKLTEKLQEAIDAVQDADRVLLAYGNCGNAVQGLVSGDFELIVPRIDDCVSLLFGSQRLREWYGSEYKAFYFTDGWMDEGHNIIDDYNRTLERYGEEHANDIYGMMYAHYKTMCYLETGLYDVEALMEKTRFIGDICELEQRREPATLSYIERLVLGPWDEELFVRVEPHGVVPAAPFREPGSIVDVPLR